MGPICSRALTLSDAGVWSRVFLIFGVVFLFGGHRRVYVVFGGGRGGWGGVGRGSGGGGGGGGGLEEVK